MLVGGKVTHMLIYWLGQALGARYYCRQKTNYLSLWTIVQYIMWPWY